METNSFINNAKLDYAILLSASPSEREWFAAKEFANFIKEALGVYLPIYLGKSNVNKFISIGKTCALAENNITILEHQLGEDGFRLYSINGNFYICGGSDYGTIFGVYEALKKLINLKIYAKDCYTFSSCKNIVITDLDEIHIPDIKVRTIGMCPVHGQDSTYIYRMRLREMTEGWGIANHSYFKIMPPQKYKETHPDWYSQGDNGINLCLSNEEMKLEFIENMKKIIESTPNDTYYMMGQQDSNSFCKCEKCLAAVQESGFESSLMIKFSNDVVKALNKWLKKTYPNRYVEFCTFAYQKTIIPPVTLDVRLGKNAYTPVDKNLHVEKNLAVMVAPLAASVGISYFDPQNRLSFGHCYNTENSVRTRDLLCGWRAIVSKLYIWSYSIDYTDYLCPFPCFGAIEQNYKMYAKLKTHYIFEEGAYNSYIPNLTQLKIYLFSQMMWDSSQSVAKLIKDFTTNYFGKDYGRRVVEYIALIEDQGKYIYKTFNRPMLCIRFDDFDDIVSAKFWSKEFLDKAIAIFDTAGINQNYDCLTEQDWRFLSESTPVKYLALTNYFNDYPKEIQIKFYTDIKKIRDKYNVDILQEGNKSLKTILSKFKESIGV